MTGNASVTMKIANPDPGAVARESDIYAELLPLAGARVMELGCGAADHTLRIAKKYPTARITGFEVDAIQHAKNLKVAAPQNVRFVEGGAQRILAPDASVDVVLMFKSLHHVPVSEMDTALAEIARVLVPGGLAYISEPVFAGELNDIIRIFNDEQHVRQHAFDAVRQTVRRLDANLPVFDVKSMETQVAESLFVERMVAALSVAFGGIATLLAAIGLYGVMSYAVARRTREIGIRMALGAEPRGVLWLVLKEVALLSVVGVTAGLLTAFFAARRVESQLFGLAPNDPVTLGSAVALLLTVALIAGFVPARRATRIDPLLALRTE